MPLNCMLQAKQRMPELPIGHSIIMVVGPAIEYDMRLIAFWIHQV
jgi:hypothetical protein